MQDDASDLNLSSAVDNESNHSHSEGFHSPQSQELHSVGTGASSPPHFQVNNRNTPSTSPSSQDFFGFSLNNDNNNNVNNNNVNNKKNNHNDNNNNNNSINNPIAEKKKLKKKKKKAQKRLLMFPPGYSGECVDNVTKLFGNTAKEYPYNTDFRPFKGYTEGLCVILFCGGEIQVSRQTYELMREGVQNKLYVYIV